MGSVTKGERFERWTVIGDATPHFYGDGVGRPPVKRDRVRVECVCGKRSTVAVRDLLRGRTTGCTSQTCREEWRVQKRVEKALDALREGLHEEADLRAYDLAQEWMRAFTMLLARDPNAPTVVDLLRAVFELERGRRHRRRRKTAQPDGQLDLLGRLDVQTPDAEGAPDAR